MRLFNNNVLIIAISLFANSPQHGVALSTTSSGKNSQTDVHKRRDIIPMIYVSGTHLEVGYAIGEAFGKLIQEFLKEYQPLEEYLKIYNTNEGKQIYEECLQVTNEYFPQYVIELKGMAKGAGIPFHHLFLIHMDEILPSVVQNSSVNNKGTGCTTIMFNLPCKEQYIGHNEDALSVTLNHFYIVNAHIMPATEELSGVFEAREEKWAAMTYAGSLSGYASGYNQYGLVFSVNTIFAKKLLRGRIPRTFITRALLASKDNLHEIQEILENQGTGTADAFHVNVGFLNENPATRVFYSIEVTPFENHFMSRVIVKPVKPSFTSFYTNKLSFSTRFCEELKETGWSSSIDREKLYEKLTFQKPIQSLRDVLRVLGGTQPGKRGDIYRDSYDDFVKTINTGVFDFMKKKWILWTKNPTTSRPLLELPLNFHTSNTQDEYSTVEKTPLF